MKVIEFKMDRTNRVVTIKYALTGDEMQKFDITRTKTIQDIADDMSRSYTPDHVVRATFRALDFPIELYDKVTDAHAVGRFRKMVEVRSACMYQLRKHTEMSLQAIGKMFNLTHASVIHNIKRFQDQLDLNNEEYDLIDREVEYDLAEVYQD